MFCHFFGEIRWCLFAPPNDPRPVQHTGGSNCPVSSRPGSPSVLHLRADCGGRLFAAKLGVVVHYLPHQESEFSVDDFIRFIGIDFV